MELMGFEPMSINNKYLCRLQKVPEVLEVWKIGREGMWIFKFKNPHPLHFLKTLQ
jgi:hypothetical protein